MEPTWERIDPPPLEETHRYELMPIGTRARVADLEAQVAALSAEPEAMVSWIIGWVLGDYTPGEYDEMAKEGLTAFLQRRSHP